MSGWTDAGRDAVEVGLQLLVQLHQAALDVLADLEAHDDQALARARGGVDVFHAGNFPEQLLHRPGGALLDFLGAEARHRDQHVDHRHLDLRLLLAREHDHRGPKSTEVMTISGVSFESMNGRAMRPAIPKREGRMDRAASWPESYGLIVGEFGSAFAYDAFALLNSRQDFDSSPHCLPVLTRRSRAVHSRQRRPFPSGPARSRQTLARAS